MLCFTPSKLSAGREGESEGARERPSLVTATGCFISGNFSMRFVYTGPRLDKGSRSRGSSSTTTEWVLMPTKGGKGNSLSLSSYIVLPLPFAACTCLPCPCQLSCCALLGSGLVWFTSNNWQHHTSTTFVPALSSPSLCLSVTLSTLVLPTASHKSLCKALSSSLCCCPPSCNLSIMFHSLFFAFVFSIRKPKAEQDFPEFRFFFVLCHVNEQRTRLSGIMQDLSGVSFGLIESVINMGAQFV